jgi:hypothetical protein
MEIRMLPILMGCILLSLIVAPHGADEKDPPRQAGAGNFG